MYYVKYSKSLGYLIGIISDLAGTINEEVDNFFSFAYIINDWNIVPMPNGRFKLMVRPTRVAFEIILCEWPHTRLEFYERRDWSILGSVIS